MTTAVFLAIGWATAASASPVTVTEVTARQAGDGSWTFAVTLDHADTGWDHYANRWEVVSEDGETVLGTRILHHPHVNEMPFTRSQSGIQAPRDAKKVLVRAYDNISDEAGPAHIFEMVDP